LTASPKGRIVTGSEMEVQGPECRAVAGCCPSGCMRAMQPILALPSAPVCMHRSAATKEDLHPSWSYAASQSIEKRSSAHLAHAQPACRTSTSRDSESLLCAPRCLCSCDAPLAGLRSPSGRCTPQLPAARDTRGTGSHRPVLHHPSSRLPHKIAGRERQPS
jgi:hypothetical protein